MKHNKKRNTAFLYESLIKELTKSIIKEDLTKKAKIMKIVKKYFNKESALYEDLRIYRYIYESETIEPDDVEKYLFEVKRDFYSLDRKKVFNQQLNIRNSSLGSGEFRTNSGLYFYNNS